MKTSKILFLISFGIASVLLVAAIGKILFPLEENALWHKGVGYSQILFCLILPVFRLKAWMWVMASLLFSIFLGFSLYALTFQLPCGCFGNLFAKEHYVPIGILGVFFVGCVASLRICGIKESSRFSLVILSMGLAAILGYLMAATLHLESAKWL